MASFLSGMQLMSPNFVFCCPTCGVTHSLYVSEASPTELQEEIRQLQGEKLYLNHICEAQRDRLEEVEAMVAWDSLNGTAIADLL